MKKLVLIAFALLTAVACGEHKDAVYGNPGDQAFIFWDRTAVTTGVPIDQELIVDYKVGLTIPSQSDVTVQIEVVEGENFTSLNANNYEILTPTVTIPAGEFFGTLSIRYIDDEVLTTDNELLVLRLVSSSLEGASVSNTLANITVRQICPIEEDLFVGAYTITELTPEGGFGPIFENEATLQFVDGTARRWEGRLFPGAGTFNGTFNFSMVCNEIVWQLYDTNLVCGGAQPSIKFLPAPERGEYDALDDSEFTLTFIIDYGSCGGPDQLATFRFTKQ